MKKKIIIIGGSGKLGTNLINNLKNDYKIFNLSPEDNKSKFSEFIKFDLKDDSSIKKFFNKKINNIVCIINCTRFRSLSKNENIENFENTIKVEVKNYFFFIEEFIKKRNFKNISILNISSTNSILISHQFFSYHLSKNVIETLTKYFSIKYIKHNIKVNCLRLGLISTKSLSKIIKPKIIKKFNLQSSVPNYKQISKFIKKNYIEDALLNGTTLTLDGSLTNIDQIYFNTE